MLHPLHVSSLLAFAQDNDSSQQAAKAFGGMMAGMIGFIILIGVAILAFVIFLFWRIFTKAGMSGAFSLFILLYPIGFLIVLCILAFGDWKVVPVQTASPYLPPVYPPPPPPPPYLPPTQV